MTDEEPPPIGDWFWKIEPEIRIATSGFCPDDGAMLMGLPQESRRGRRSKKDKNPDSRESYVKCVRCDTTYLKGGPPQVIVSVAREKETLVLEDSGGNEMVGYKCEKCGSTKGYFDMKQLDHSDEPPVRIYKCGACGYVERGTS